MSANQAKTLRPLSLRHPVKPAFGAHTALALSISAALCSPLAMAQEEETFELDTLQIEERTIDTNPYAEPGAPYKAKYSGDKRKVKPLAETPQTITVLTQTQIKDSGKDDLKEILAAQPGLTLGTGENGNAFGDRYIIRGHEARSDVFVDGLRDPGMTTRESFALEQVEITKGPSSTFAGRGSTGGAVNGVTKQASTEYSFNEIEGGVGTDDYRRATLDSNVALTDDIAVRLNLLHAYREIPDRGPADRERNGIALAGAWQATDKLDFKADYYYLDAKDTPDLGSYVDRATGKPNDDVPVYLQRGDFLESDVETFTFRVGYDFTTDLRLENAMRYGTTENGYVVTGARGNTDLITGTPTIGLSTHQGWQEVDYFANITNLYWDKELAGKLNQFVFSTEYSKHDVLNGDYNTSNGATPNCVLPGRGGRTSPGYCIIDPNGNLVPNLRDFLQRSDERGASSSDYSIETVSVSLMDTIDLTDKWILAAGVRADHFEYTNDIFDDGDVTRYEYSDTLWNGHLGLTYKINEYANVYATYSTAVEINGGESDVGGNCGYGGICGSPDTITQSEPEKSTNYEIGTKWNVFDEKLLLTAAAFHITKDDVMESVGDDYETIGTYNTGKNRVHGVEVSAAGNLTENLSTVFGATVMNAKVLESYEEANEGGTLAQFADKSMYLQLRYQLTPALAVGTAATYRSEVYTGQPDSAASDLGVPSYTVYDAFATYDFTDNLSARLNVVNLTDEDYYFAAYRSGSFAYIGDRRNARVTLAYEF
ncbi:catecholate siderophore receptor [Halopseudomonas xinjiangensis]|uniref:Catecholate siderophore receptor n=1 Tax=Halopseudomonas xinjiangensis TaxID=487184 RepID=A0A1H1Q0I7_9GAMM|nr:TonB-dependent siderophore receptor [Halopseudomonas xinjiangensis]SDS17051.1 catecholate siderophore receptor [Halopseudomonas xinjiangensis]